MPHRTIDLTPVLPPGCLSGRLEDISFPGYRRSVRELAALILPAVPAVVLAYLHQSARSQRPLLTPDLHGRPVRLRKPADSEGVRAAPVERSRNRPVLRALLMRVSGTSTAAVPATTVTTDGKIFDIVGGLGAGSSTALGVVCAAYWDAVVGHGGVLVLFAVCLLGAWTTGRFAWNRWLSGGRWLERRERRMDG